MHQAGQLMAFVHQRNDFVSIKKEVVSIGYLLFQKCINGLTEQSAFFERFYALTNFKAVVINFNSIIAFFISIGLF